MDRVCQSAGDRVERAAQFGCADRGDVCAAFVADGWVVRGAVVAGAGEVEWIVEAGIVNHRIASVTFIFSD